MSGDGTTADVGAVIVEFINGVAGDCHNVLCRVNDSIYKWTIWEKSLTLGGMPLPGQIITVIYDSLNAMISVHDWSRWTTVELTDPDSLKTVEDIVRRSSSG